MIISVNWVKKFTDIDLTIDELTKRIGERLVEIEEVIPLGEKYKDVIIVRVVDCRPVEDSDHLNLTYVDDGGVVEGVERDERGYIQVVCGAPNVHAGMLAAWLPPNSVVPETFDDAEPFVLGARTLRGYLSNGMLASAKELALYDDHQGIIEIDKEVTPGSSFAEVYELNDYLLDIENKSLTHRPDAFGVIGFAREVAGIQGKPFTTPEWLMNLTSTASPQGELVEAPRIVIEDADLSARFSAVVFADANEAAVSPLEIQTYLARSGMRPISAIVDVTNYLMLLTGQPLHAYDYDKLLAVSGGVNEVRVRRAHTGETLTIIDGRTLELSESDTVIAAGEVAVGLAGAMGGAATEIDASTTRILLECATFNLYDLRAVQMRHGIFSEAITRLTKGIPAPLGIPVLDQAVTLLSEFAGARVASQVVQDYPGQQPEPTVHTSVSRINSLLGTELSESEIVNTLRDVEFTVDAKADELLVTAPYWRHDIAIAEDVTEEVGRLRGFDTIHPRLPRRDFTAVAPSQFDQLRSRVRNILVRAGANEVLTYSFVHGDTMRKALQNPDEAYRIINSISPELQYYRQSLTPSLLGAVHPNAKAGYDHFALFEFNKFHTKRHELSDEAVPKELDSLAFVLARTKKTQGAAFYEVKQYVEYIARSLGTRFVYEPLDADNDYPVTQPFEPKRSARIWNEDKTIRIGVIGEYRRSVAASFKLPDYAAGFEIAPRALLQLSQLAGRHYEPLSRFPGSDRDVCFQIPEALTYDALLQAIAESTEHAPFSVSVSPLDLYRPAQEPVKNITVRFSFVSDERTLTGEEVTTYMNTVITDVTTKTEGKVI
jgi:phenylalanyl-tRNA synthetase beta chain